MTPDRRPILGAEQTNSRPSGGALSGDQPPLRRLRSKLAHQWRWARQEGFSRWIEEDQLNPVDRARTALSKWQWRRRHGVLLGEAVPVYLVGVQRSGTNMLVRGLEAAPEFEVHNENDRAAFDHYRLRSDRTIADLVNGSRHQYVLLKPLCDSHRVDELLDGLQVARSARAIWAYRDVDGRVRSALNKFGDVNLKVLTEMANGSVMDRWQAQRVSPANLDLIRSFDYSAMSPETAAALFWYIRNSLFFELGLHERNDTFLSSYDLLVTDPAATMTALCGFIGFPYEPTLTQHIEVRPNSQRPQLLIDPRVRHLCDTLTTRLDQVGLACVRKWSLR